MTITTPVYLDYHGTTPCDKKVVEAMLPYFTSGFGNPSAIKHQKGREAAHVIATVKKQIGDLINAPARSIILTSGATEANNITLLGLPFEPQKNEILVSDLEHDSVRNCIPALEEKGYRVKIIPANSAGIITPDAVKNGLSNHTALVSVIAANHEIGTLQDLKTIAELTHSFDALFHSDATQAVGKVNLDIQEMGIDLLSMSAHKLYGPVGVGALYVRSKPPLPLTPIIHGGNQQGIRSGTIPLALAVGFGKACEIAQLKMSCENKRMNHLTGLFLDEVQTNIPKIRVNGSLSQRLSGSLNLTLPIDSAEMLLLDLMDELCISTGSACASQSNKPSPTLKAIGLSDEDIFKSIRISFGRMTTEEDVYYAARQIICAVNN